MILSKSGIGTFFECPLKFYYSRVLDVEPTAEAEGRMQHLGKVWGSILDYHWTRQEIPWSTLDVNEYDREILKAIYRGYLRAWSHEPMPDHVDPEVEFDIPEYGIRGRFDKLVHTPGQVTIIEHKLTTTDFRFRTHFTDKVAYDWQVGLYQLAAKHMFPGQKVSLVYDVARMPGNRPRRGEDPEVFGSRIGAQLDYHLQTVQWSEDQFDRLRSDLSDIHRSLAVCQRENLWPRSRDCHRWGRTCEYYDVCHGDAQIDDERLYNIRKRDQ